MSDINNTREKRLTRDRENARERRKRKKYQVESLQQNLSEFTTENRILQDQNNALREEVVRLRTEVLKLNQTRSIFHDRIAYVTSGSRVPQWDHRSDLFRQALLLGMGNQNDLRNQTPLTMATPNIPENTSSFNFTNNTYSLHTSQLQHILPTRNVSLIDRTGQYLFRQQLEALGREYSAEPPQAEDTTNLLHFSAQNAEVPETDLQR